MASESPSGVNPGSPHQNENKAPPPRGNVPSGDQTGAAPSKKDRITQLAASLLMILATLGSSWSGFQSGLWNGIQTFRLADATKLSRLSSENAIVANQLRSVDAAGFIEYARAISENNTHLAEFVRDRMRPEFRPALDAWLATKPLQNPEAPPSPFQMQQYNLKAQQEATDQDRLASSMREQAQQANRNVDTYGLAVLLFTSALLLAGLLTGLSNVRVKWIMIGLSIVFMSVAGVVLSGLPIAHRS